MTVEVWYGTRSEHRGEQDALIEIYHVLSIQPEHFVVLSNFEAATTNEIDLLILKEQGIFIAELKSCNARIVGQKEGPWRGFPPSQPPFVLHPQNSNPYKQIKVNWGRFRDWCERNGAQISLGVMRSQPVDFRSMRSFVVVAPDLQPDSEIDVGGGPVQVVGLPLFLKTVMMYITPRISLSRQEMSRIPRFLNLTQWHLIPTETERLDPLWQPSSCVLLVARGHDLSVPLFDLGGCNKTFISIGRDADNDLVISSPAVSRQHAEIRKVGDRWAVRDLNSENGTYVSYKGDPSREQRLAQNADNALQNHSIVRFGPASYTLLLNP